MRLSPTPNHTAAFSLVEFSLATTVTILMMSAVIYTHVMGQNLHLWSQSKVGANDHSRETLAKLQDEIRSAKLVEIGIYTNGQFRTPRIGQPQIGTTMRIFPSTNTSEYLQYRLRAENNVFVLKRAQVNRNGNFGVRTVGQHLTNNPAMFALEDFRGRRLTERSANGIIAVTLDFRQFQYPITKVGSEYYYDYYRLQTRIAKRMVE